MATADFDVWPDTADICLGRLEPRLTKLQVVEFLKSIGVAVSSLDALVDVPGDIQQVIRLVFSSRKDHTDFLANFEGCRRVKLLGQEDHPIVVSDKSVNWKFVKIANLPTRTDLDALKGRLTIFGTIKTIDWERYSDSSIPDLKGVKNGWLKAQIVIKYNIPSYISVGPHRVFVQYSGQKRRVEYAIHLITCRMHALQEGVVLLLIVVMCPRTKRRLMGSKNK